jgi:hypothetical protein
MWGRDAETAMRTGDLGLVLLIGAAVVIAATVSAVYDPQPGPLRLPG